MVFAKGPRSLPAGAVGAPLHGVMRRHARRPRSSFPSRAGVETRTRRWRTNRKPPEELTPLRRCRPLAPASLAEADEAVEAHDDVIENRDSAKVADLPETRGQLDVGPRRCGIA